MRTTVNGLEFTYRSHGTGPTLVLLHAFPLNMRMFEAQVAALADHMHVVTIDFRGFGASQLTSGDFSLEELADDVHALMAKLGHAHFVLGGVSMGGYVALAYLRRHPETLRGLILANTRAGADTEEARQRRFKAVSEITSMGTGGLAATFPQTALAPGSVEARQDLVGQLHAWIAEANPMAVIGAQLAMANRPDSTALLPGIALPTLVIAGEQDGVTPPEEARRMAEAIPGATIATIPGAGHLSNMEQPEAFNEAVRAFMAQFPD
ncbi:MAG: alpha/beta fold hydrolase [Candidatus Sericytochromatia bacterium]